MNKHAEGQKTEMFKEATNTIKSKLSAMCRAVEENMANKADEVRLN